MPETNELANNETQASEYLVNEKIFMTLEDIARLVPEPIARKKRGLIKREGKFQLDTLPNITRGTSLWRVGRYYFRFAHHSLKL